MPEYDVSWSITVCDTTDPLSAVRNAYLTMQSLFADPEALCTIFVVTDQETGQTWTVDLAEEPEDQVIAHHV